MEKKFSVLPSRESHGEPSSQVLLTGLGRQTSGVNHRSKSTQNTIKQMREHASVAAQDLKYGRKHGFPFHVLRHTGASRMVEAGFDLRTVPEIGAWASLRQLSRYTYPTQERKWKWAFRGFSRQFASAGLPDRKRRQGGER